MNRDFPKVYLTEGSISLDIGTISRSHILISVSEGILFFKINPLANDANNPTLSIYLALIARNPDGAR